MASMLNVYKTYHPESHPYADAAKYFFREVSKGERDYAGVIIFAFKDDASGRIILEGEDDNTGIVALPFRHFAEEILGSICIWMAFRMISLIDIEHRRHIRVSDFRRNR